MNTDRLASTMRRAPVMLPVALCLLLVCVSSGAAMPAYEHHVKLRPENSVTGNYPADKKPILTVKSGATVRIDRGGGNRWGDEEPMSWIAHQGLKLTP